MKSRLFSRTRNDVDGKGKYPAYPACPVSTIRALFLNSVGNHPEKPALQHKQGGRWIPITYRELANDVELIACGLAALGLAPQAGKLAIVGDNRPEWAACYLAAACTGVVCVPIDRDLKEAEVHNILLLSGAQAIVCDDKHVDMIMAVRARLPGLALVVTMDELRSVEGTLTLAGLKEEGRRRIGGGRNVFAEAAVSADNLLSILFTSGTMGNPKGVMLTHGNVSANIVSAVRWVNLRPEDRFLSVLPIHHSYECTDGFLLPIYRGATISYAENLRRLAENLAETRSTAVLGVPLLWHAVYRKIEIGLEEAGLARVARAKSVAAFSERWFGLNIRRLLFAKVHRRFGGAWRVLISGGAAVDPAVARGFRELGFTFLQGYGLTESAPIIAVNRDEAFRDDAAGLPLPDVEVRIAEDGEILARGPNIMVGYYNNSEGSREALEDGWLHTGDLGFIDTDGFLYVKGRKKSVIVTPSGKKVYPEEVEGEILKSPYILECLVWGSKTDRPDQQPVVEAIVVPDRDNPEVQALEREMDGELRIERLVRTEVKNRCLRLASFKRVSRITVSREELEKTTTKKIKRYLYSG